MKYKFEVLLCLGVFGAGAVWSKIFFPSEFWKVGSIHDLFEIFGAIATSIAVYIAASWKKQLGSSRDYELARKIAIAIFQYRESSIEVWAAAYDCLQKYSEQENLEKSLRKEFALSIEARLENAQSFRAEIQAHLVECRAIWKNGIDKDFSEVFYFEQVCSKCARLYLATISPEIHPLDAITARGQLPRFKEFLEKKGMISKDAAALYMDDELKSINAKLESIMK
ncbi:hypothetical protein ABFV57_10090 [Pseudomonas neuropathica]|uniref:hypothetical protein n=1 Tax=Pseudomonas neuropathica TaxID=2730425 RepID=UPI0034D73079